MLDIELPWWEFIVRGAIVYFFLLLLVRISGKRTVGQFTPFDLLVVMLLSEAVSNSLSGADESLVGGLIVATTLIAINSAIAILSARNRKFAEAVDGTPVLLGRDGRIFDDVRKHARVAESDIEEALRESNCSLSDVQYIFLEPDGNLSVQKKK